MSTVLCADCGLYGQLEAIGLCSGCYSRNLSAGTLDDYRRVAGLPSVPALDVSWHEDALCAETDPEMFFPEKGGSTREAIGVCRKCLVRAECLDYALATGERFGIWGGLSERRRRRLLRLDEEAAA